ncbi:MAG: DNA mismatch repair endonuclease MutL [Clostridiales bacterium]|jgi:DNA mismatch repair protein MutL|nr:DNA mismatch repair endonuclease MutL [Clostridiales bacterium]
MSIIKVLPLEVSEKIAAGEVVSRPGSVIKELVENAIDAGAKRIVIETKNGGVSQICVIDDGVGMSADDASLAFLRHATSKISTADDLDAISTMGFRGEALCAISAVSKTSITTRQQGSDIGVCVTVHGGNPLPAQECGCPIGTKVEVTDLFYNTPARRKFLKSTATENGNNLNCIQQIVLGHADIAFKVVVDGRVKFSTNGSGDLTQVIYSIYGKDYAENCLNVDYSSGRISVDGVVGKIETFRSNKNFQTFFINGRYIRSALVSDAVQEAHKDRIMVGKYPFCVLNLTIPYDEIDINVHPEKLEVKFSDEGRIYDSVLAAVKSAIAKPMIDKAGVDEAESESEFEGFDDKPQFNGNAIETLHKPTVTTINVKPIDATKLNPVAVFSQTDMSELITSEATMTSNVQVVHTVGSADETNNHLDSNKADEASGEVADNARGYRIIGQAFDTYIIIEVGEKIYFIDQHAAHERKIYEELLKNGAPAKQQLLISQRINVSPVEFEKIMSLRDELDKLSFEVDEFGDNCIIVRTVPQDFPLEHLKEDILSVIGDGITRLENVDSMRNRMHTIACKAAIKANDALQMSELDAIVAWIMNQNDVETCPHGRPLVKAFTKYELEKMFKRVV